MQEVIRTTIERATADEWALVLTAAGVESSLTASPHGWHLSVAARHASKAAALLDAYDREQQEKTVAIGAPPADYGTTYAGGVVVALLISFHVITTRFTQIDWFRVGAASAGAIDDGELWRTITALTLHAGLAHVANNVVAGAIFFTAAFRVWGPGLGLWLVLLSGALGNFANAVVRPLSHSGVGASTAVFGAVGLLAGYQFSRRRAGRTVRGARWLPIAAGLALLAWLGASPHSDVVAHLFGFLVGIPLAVLAARRLPQPPTRHVQWMLLAAATLTVASCWLMAVA